ncbi:ABC transporter substrate-binding protein, partial [Candidatus Phytoplasma aurantifolia]|nr:ABC transporter substrate-binding protein [Candidatus Phytoplasma aurantifolia]
MIWILIAIFLGSLSIFLLIYFRFLQNKKIITLIISIFILIILSWTILKHYHKQNNDLHEKNKHNKHILTLGLTVPVQDGFGIFGQGSNTTINSYIRDLFHEYLIKAYPSKENNYYAKNYKPRLLDAMPLKQTQGEFKGYYKCNLIPGIKFHNGRLLTNQDIVNNVIYNKEKGGEHSGFIRDIKLDNNDKNCFFILFTDDQDPLNYHHLSKVPIILFEGEDSTIPNRRIGLGPFQLKEFDNNNIKLERFNDYYKKNDYIESNIRQIKACYIPDIQTINMHLKKGDIDVSFVALDKTSSKDLSRHSDLQIIKPESLIMTYLFLNCQKLSLEERRSIAEALSPEQKQKFLNQLGE